jgi:hypothetical protein
VGTSAVAAVVIAKEKRIVDAFRRGGAISVTSAVTPSVIGVSERAAFGRLRKRAVLQEASPGAFYLDEASWQALRATRRRMALGALLVVLLAAIIAWWRTR